MALFRIDHLPETVKMNVPLDIILPDPGRMNGNPVRSRKVLYLLHGLSDDASTWQRYTSIESTASAYGLVVIMPSVGRSFYTDQPNGQCYFTYLAEELPRYLEEVFHLSPRREDTYLAGISMGGYGAFKLAFHQPERFTAVASFSGVLNLEVLHILKDDQRRAEFELLFGNLASLAGSEHDPAVWIRRMAATPQAMPQLYVACGRQDDMYPVNLMAVQALRAAGLKVDYYEEDARHDWFFWDAQIKRYLEAVLGPRPVI